jgi:hypothetical protein
MTASSATFANAASVKDGGGAGTPVEIPPGEVSFDCFEGAGGPGTVAGSWTTRTGSSGWPSA